MANAAGLAVNELWNGFLDVTNTPQMLPGMAVVNRGRFGFQQVRPDNSQPWNPGHAYMVLESGAIRVKCDGTAPDAGLGTLYVAAPAGSPPTVIDWTDVNKDYQALLKNFQVVLQSGATARLSISFQN